MKQIYFIIIACLTLTSIQAQIVNIPDANFKNALLNHTPVIDTNEDGDIQISEATAFTYYIDVPHKNIADMTGIEAFINITGLVGIDNLLTSLNLTQNTNIEWLEIFDNQISSIDLSQNLALTGFYPGRNLLTELDVSANVNLVELWVGQNLLTALDLSNNPLLDVLFCDGNMIETLDLSQNTLLTSVICENNLLTQLTLPESSILEDLGAKNNNLTSLDFSNQPMLIAAGLNNNPLTTLDFSFNPQLQILRLDNMPQLTSLFLKNGSILNPSSFDLQDTENLEFICADQFEIDQLRTILTSYGYNSVVLNSYCSFVPGGKVFTLQGACYFDSDDNGCDVDDSVFPLLKYSVTNGTTTEYFFNDSNGNYYLPLQEGNYTITPVLENIDYFTMTPASLNIDLPTVSNPYIQNFCIAGGGIYNDLEVIIIPLEAARPGFDTDYRIVYKNKGQTLLSGTVELLLENSNKTHFVASTPAADTQTNNQLFWNYSNLEPFESRTIDVVININPPTHPSFPVNGGDSIGLTSNILPLTGDETPSDNNFQLKQIVVNSFDPNDKTCLEGDSITPEMVGEYVHYLIRFENTGTAEATNVVVKDVIDTSKFDVSTLIPLHSSHNFVTRIKETNELEFIFQNINLPFDDANNDGFVAFKIKTLSTLALGDTFTNDAEIYFDYNAPILTNDFLTTVAEPLTVDEYNSNSVKYYPNPVLNELSIESKFGIHSATMYDMNGRLLNTIAFTDHAFKQTIDVSRFSKGIYFVSVKSDAGAVNLKIIKE